MKIAAKPEDNNKVIGLVAGVVGVFGFVIFRTMSALGGSGAEAPPIEGVVKSPNGDVKVALGGPPAGAAASAGPDVTLIDIKTFPPGSTPNPFHKSVDPGGITANKKGNGNRPGRNPILQNSQDQVLTVPNDTPPEPITVMGVNMGRNPVVVMQVGDKAFVVDKGARFGKGMRVKEVSEKQVIIDDGKELRYIRVGLQPPAPAQPKPDASKAAGAETLPAIQSKKLSGSI